jgi:hypothetical protein
MEKEKFKQIIQHALDIYIEAESKLMLILYLNEPTVGKLVHADGGERSIKAMLVSAFQADPEFAALTRSALNKYDYFEKHSKKNTAKTKFKDLLKQI